MKYEMESRNRCRSLPHVKFTVMGMIEEHYGRASGIFITYKIVCLKWNSEHENVVGSNNFGKMGIERNSGKTWT